ncbi:hypothetical protein [Mycoplasmoides pneumoniae]|uniref:LPXTG cell wall anchor domain-containing protein n=1 Tax=Mycoplasmoides pneumoniae TaxID=2104 RepID=A0AB38W652_MYCPM|nr:hypothetical protein [Mycoplasmoides pneumoniae]VEU56834.1 Uncharacterised protein [Mycoplasmoides pneumoniae]GLL57430.1 hypothetical protein KPI25BX_1920 [Mycoplasmoides pneumoniae]GLL58071.1 hypothetical protein Y1241N_1180 [Mycoplasmoides pneumoniae]GLL58865.1 hypothetical protein Y12242BV_1890 [Mycoplasmoides pneumoniae]GLL59630.1 hypothetical protein Y12382J_2360 [Mycoplasmoides pneumoniae]
MLTWSLSAIAGVLALGATAIGWMIKRKAASRKKKLAKETIGKE